MNKLILLMQHCAASNSRKLIAPVLTISIIVKQWLNVFNADYPSIEIYGIAVIVLLLLILFEGIYKTLKGRKVESKKTESYKTFSKEQLTLFFSWFGFILLCQHFFPEGIENKIIIFGGPCVILLIILSTIKHFKKKYQPL